MTKNFARALSILFFTAGLISFTRALSHNDHVRLPPAPPVYRSLIGHLDNPANPDGLAFYDVQNDAELVYLMILVTHGKLVGVSNLMDLDMHELLQGIDRATPVVNGDPRT